jgi:hypothetical protein
MKTEKENVGKDLFSETGQSGDVSEIRTHAIGLGRKFESCWRRFIHRGKQGGGTAKWRKRYATGGSRKLVTGHGEDAGPSVSSR